MNPKEIKQLRNFIGLTQLQFGHLIGNGVAIVNRWENGKGRPSKRSMIMINVIRDAQIYIKAHARALLIMDIEDATRIMFREALR